MRYAHSQHMPSTMALTMAFSHPNLLIQLDVHRALRVLCYLERRSWR